MLRAEHAHFSSVWDHASAQQRLLLQALAAEPGRALTTDYRRRHDLPPATTVQSAVTALERQELVPTSAATSGSANPSSRSGSARASARS